MTKAALDRLGLAERLEEAGFSNDQARGAAAALRDFLEPQVATKADLDLLEERLNHRITRQTIVLGGWATGLTAIIIGAVTLLLRGHP